MKYYIFLFLLIVSFLFGVSTGIYQHFPYNTLRKLKYRILGEPSNYKRNIEFSSFKKKEVKISNRTGIYLTYGQSNSVNHGQIGYDVKGKVFQFFQGNTFKYEDPSLGGTGQGGSVWGMVGDKLIINRNNDQVIFANCGWGDAKIEELNRGPYIEYLLKNHRLLMEKFGRVDGILFHQGESNNFLNGGRKNYYDEFVKLIVNLKNNGIEIPIYLSRVSYCGDKTSKDDKLIEIQNKLIKDFSIVFEGPNTDLLTEKKYRLPDNCHFSMLGFDKFSDMWVDSLSKSKP